MSSPNHDAVLASGVSWDMVFHHLERTLPKHRHDRIQAPDLWEKHQSHLLRIMDGEEPTMMYMYDAFSTRGKCRHHREGSFSLDKIKISAFLGFDGADAMTKHFQEIRNTIHGRNDRDLTMLSFLSMAYNGTIPIANPPIITPDIVQAIGSMPDGRGKKVVQQTALNAIFHHHHSRHERTFHDLDLQALLPGISMLTMHLGTNRDGWLMDAMAVKPFHEQKTMVEKILHGHVHHLTTPRSLVPTLRLMERYGHGLESQFFHRFKATCPNKDWAASLIGNALFSGREARAIHGITSMAMKSDADDVHHILASMATILSSDVYAYEDNLTLESHQVPLHPLGRRVIERHLGIIAGAS